MNIIKTLIVIAPIALLIIAEICCGVYVPMPVWVIAMHISLGLMCEVVG